MTINIQLILHVYQCVKYYKQSIFIGLVSNTWDPFRCDCMAMIAMAVGAPCQSRGRESAQHPVDLKPIIVSTNVLSSLLNVKLNEITHTHTHTIN